MPIRLTEERWAHIVENHDYMAGYEDYVLETLSDPQYIVRGWFDEKIACKYYEKTHLGSKWIIAIYKEISSKDGFVITALMTSDIEKILRRGILWEK